MIICDMGKLSAGTAQMTNQEREEKRIHDIRGLAIIIHKKYCENEKMRIGSILT